MKKRTFCFLFFLISFNNLQAQVFVNNKDINLLEEVVYIEVILDSRAFQRGKSFVLLDYGQLIRNFTVRDNRITDQKGEDILFNGEMDVFHFLYRNGWIHETTYAKETWVYHIFRRKGLAK